MQELSVRQANKVRLSPYGKRMVAEKYVQLYMEGDVLSGCVRELERGWGIKYGDARRTAVGYYGQEYIADMEAEYHKRNAKRYARVYGRRGRRGWN